MAEDATSQGTFMGWLAMGLLVFAVVVALIVTVAGLTFNP